MYELLIGFGVWIIIGLFIIFMSCPIRKKIPVKNMKDATYEEWEEEHKDLIKACGLPLDKE